VEPNTVEDNKRIVREAEDAWNAGDLDRAFGYFSPDYVENSPFPGLPPTIDGVKQLLTAFRGAFPDGHVTIDLMVAEGDTVAYHSTARGTHQAEFMGIQPTYRSVEVAAIHMHRLADGLIVEHWGQSDSLGLMRQLGQMPGEAGLPERG
jgi:predicted ester cyclase